MLPIGSNYQTNIEQMGAIMKQVDAMFPQLDHFQICCLSTSLINEYDRWLQIIQEGVHPSIEDYEYELIKLDALIESVDECIANNDNTPLSFGMKQSELLIEAVDNEYEKVSSEDPNGAVIVGQTRQKIRQAAIEAFGIDILSMAHRKTNS